MKEENITKSSKEKKPKNGGEEKKKEVKRFSTHTGHTLTPNEARFIDKYIETSNGRQSYIEAYPNSNEKNAHQNAYRLLNRDYIVDEINFRFEQAKNESIASAEEIMQYFTDVMRGKIKDQFELEASLGERTKAAQELAKRLIDIPNKLNGNEQPELKITLDFARPTTLQSEDEG